MTDLPDECPVCKGENYDEDTDEPIFAEDPAFCSKKCADKYEQWCKEELEAEESYYEEWQEYLFDLFLGEREE